MTSSNGGVPPGFRFHPTDEELLHFYLKKKIAFEKFDMDVIREIDLNKTEPWDLQERCKIGSTPENEWYFFSHKDKKYPTGSRTNRATHAGFWKATGRDKCIRNTFKKIGMRKTLVFYRGRAPHGQKTDWIMHEYRLEDVVDQHDSLNHVSSSSEDGWVICRVFKKRNLFKVGGNEASSGSIASKEQANNMHQSRMYQSRPLSYGLDHNHQYLTYHDQHHQQQNFDLGLNYTHHQYPHLMTTTNKPLGCGFLNLPSEDSPIMVRQLMSNHRECDSGSCENQLDLGYNHACEPGLEVDISEPTQNMINANVRDETSNEWGMIDRLVTSHIPQHNGDANSTKGMLRYRDDTTSSSLMQPINQLSLRGGMEF